LAVSFFSALSDVFNEVGKSFYFAAQILYFGNPNSTCGRAVVDIVATHGIAFGNCFQVFWQDVYFGESTRGDFVAKALNGPFQ
jgi:hypothetical protein